jgi:hypothetical protein
MAWFGWLFIRLLSSFEGTIPFNFIQSGGISEEVTPVPIPNTAVKLFSADGSWGFPPVRAGRRQANQKNSGSCSFFVYKKISTGTGDDPLKEQ